MGKVTFYNAVGWISTYTGTPFNVLDPHRDQVHFSDIAHALSRQCRYSGHCVKFESVAEHCVHVARMAPDHLKLAALLHDASEAYLVDIPRPLKKLMPQYRAIEDRLMTVIGDKFGFRWPIDPVVADLDNRILLDEVTQNMATPGGSEPIPWGVSGEPLGITLQFWSPHGACYEFTKAFYAYGGRP